MTGPASQRAPGSAQAASRIRRKLILLHTLFSLTLSAMIVLAVGASVRPLVAQSEMRECRLALALHDLSPEACAALSGVAVRTGSPSTLGIDEDLAAGARAANGGVVEGHDTSDHAIAVRYDIARNEFHAAMVRSPAARAATTKLYVLLTVSLLAVYALIALTLEVFVLPKQVYSPIERLRRADEAVQQGWRDAELIPEDDIPRDELGEIMRSRNKSILKLRAQEQQLAEALDQIEVVAAELKRKNHLLETARRNLADQDRLASLGMMSAGIAHELNTPLAVLKGTVEQLVEAKNGSALSQDRVELMRRVVGRLERLGESLLDFARVRPPATEHVDLKAIADEAWTLVSLDRDARRVQFENALSGKAAVLGDADRLTQVFVNLLRNAVDAMQRSGDAPGSIRVESETQARDGRDWVSIRIVDDGPGIDIAILPRLFEPFATTRLDARGTGLGLAVAEGIIREHGGVLLARNRATPDHGAVFEMMLPVAGPVQHDTL
ncbi:MAG: hypothetical protein KDA20_12885, partial [Phycisphaerales bacterium]|nr:hypothetical protein [Phycisphaerales bacterium]